MSEAPRGPGFTDPDASYAAIVAALDSAGDARAVEFLVALVLVLAAEVGDHRRIVELVGIAARTADRT